MVAPSATWHFEAANHRGILAIRYGLQSAIGDNIDSWSPSHLVLEVSGLYFVFMVIIKVFAYREKSGKVKV